MDHDTITAMAAFFYDERIAYRMDGGIYGKKGKRK